jgi:1,4-alpha-glucan branching enzyme
MTAATRPQKPKRRRITFGIETDLESDVFVTGTFNDWDPRAKQLRDKHGTGLYEGALLLERGRHEYKFVVNGEWVVDPENPEWTANEHGSLNSTVDVR